MNHKLQSIINNFELSLSEEQNKHIISSLGITDLRKNPTPEQENHLNQVFQLIKDGQEIEQAISQALTNADLERIITEQANKAADAALLTLPNVAEGEINKLRQIFIEKFRLRIEQQLQSPEYHQAFLDRIECLGESPTLNGSTQTTALPSS